MMEGFANNTRVRIIHRGHRWMEKKLLAKDEGGILNGRGTRTEKQAALLAPSFPVKFNLSVCGRRAKIKY